MEGKKQSKRLFTQRNLMLVIALMTTIALLLTGTFAWNELQHKTNAARGGEAGVLGESKISVSLIDKFAAPLWDTDTGATGWAVGETIDKDVTVKNMETSEEGVFVRLSIKEFMEAYSTAVETKTLVVTPKLDGDGAPIEDEFVTVLFATHAVDFAEVLEDDGITVKAPAAKKGDYMTAAQAAELGLAYGSMVVGGVAYATTNFVEEENGIYGKPMYEVTVEGQDGREKWAKLSTQTKPAQTNHTNEATDECAYGWDFWNGVPHWTEGEPDVWTQEADTIRDYIKINYTDGDVIFVAAGDPVPEPGEYWIVDEATGWIYWGEMLLPGEETSKKLVDSLTLLKTPGTYFEYYMHIDMQVVDLSDLDTWTDTGIIAGTLEKMYTAEHFADMDFLDVGTGQYTLNTELVPGKIQMPAGHPLALYRMADLGDYTLVMVDMEGMLENTTTTAAYWGKANAEYTQSALLAQLDAYWQYLYGEAAQLGDLFMVSSAANTDENGDVKYLGDAADTGLNNKNAALPVKAADASNSPFFLLSKGEALQYYSNATNSEAGAKTAFGQLAFSDAPETVHLATRTADANKVVVMKEFDDASTTFASLAPVEIEAGVLFSDYYPNAFAWVKTSALNLTSGAPQP